MKIRFTRTITGWYKAAKARRKRGYLKKNVKIRYKRRKSGWWTVTHPAGRTHVTEPKVFRWLIGDVGDAQEGTVEMHPLNAMFLDIRLTDDEEVIA